MKVLIPFLFTLMGAQAQLCTDLEREGTFDASDSIPSIWNDTVSTGTVELSLVPGENGEGNALQAVNRTRWWASPRLDIDKECYTVGEHLVFSSRIHLMNTTMDPVQCTPGQIWGRFGETWVCPTMALKISTGEDNTFVDVASLAAPYSEDWNSMFGTYTVTQEFMNADSVSLIWYKTAKEIWFTIDNVSITSEANACEHLVKNGGGEAGDARNWKYYGNDGVVHAVEFDEDFTIGTKHLVSKNRVDYQDGIMTLLDPGCLDLDSLYEVSAKIKLADGATTNTANGANLTTCDYLGTWTTGGDIPRCPMVYVGAKSPGGPRQFRAVASVNEPFDTEVWNELSSVFGFFSNEVTAEELYLFIAGAPPGTDIYIEDVSLTRVASSSQMPSSMPVMND